MAGVVSWPLTGFSFGFEFVFFFFLLYCSYIKSRDNRVNRTKTAGLRICGNTWSLPIDSCICVCQYVYVSVCGIANSSVCTYALGGPVYKEMFVGNNFAMSIQYLCVCVCKCVFVKTVSRIKAKSSEYSPNTGVLKRYA